MSREYACIPRRNAPRFFAVTIWHCGTDVSAFVLKKLSKCTRSSQIPAENIYAFRASLLLATFYLLQSI